ncbi:hypothetical protein MRX96_048187 [Rhipicephalus microplus]
MLKCFQAACGQSPYFPDTPPWSHLLRLTPGVFANGYHNKKSEKQPNFISKLPNTNKLPLGCLFYRNLAIAFLPCPRSLCYSQSRVEFVPDFGVCTPLEALR